MSKLEHGKLCNRGGEGGGKRGGYIDKTKVSLSKPLSPSRKLLSSFKIGREASGVVVPLRDYPSSWEKTLPISTEPAGKRYTHIPRVSRLLDTLYYKLLKCACTCLFVQDACMVSLCQVTLDAEIYTLGRTVLMVCGTFHSTH